MIAKGNLEDVSKLLLTLLALVAAPASVIAQGSPGAPPPNADPLEIDSMALRYPQLGFSAPNPGPGFTTATDVQEMYDKIIAEAGGKGKMFYWALGRPGTRELIIIQAINNGSLGRDEEGLRKFATGMRSRLPPGSRVVEDTLTWTPRAHEYRYAILHPNGLFMKWRCVASGPTRERPLVVCATTMSPDSTSLDAFRRGLILDPGPNP